MNGGDRAVKLQPELQQDLCKIFSSQFECIHPGELSPLMAVLRMLRLEFEELQPQVYRTLVALLCDYNPARGQQHHNTTCRYIRLLLSSHPDMADYLVSILPPPALRLGDVMAPATHSLHRLKDKRSSNPALSSIEQNPFRRTRSSSRLSKASDSVPMVTTRESVGAVQKDRLRSKSAGSLPTIRSVKRPRNMGEPLKRINMIRVGTVPPLRAARQSALKKIGKVAQVGASSGPHQPGVTIAKRNAAEETLGGPIASLKPGINKPDDAPPKLDGDTKSFFSASSRPPGNEDSNEVEFYCNKNTQLEKSASVSDHLPESGDDVDKFTPLTYKKSVPKDNGVISQAFNTASQDDNQLQMDTSFCSIISQHPVVYGDPPAVSSRQESVPSVSVLVPSHRQDASSMLLPGMGSTLSNLRTFPYHQEVTFNNNENTHQLPLACYVESTQGSQDRNQPRAALQGQLVADCGPGSPADRMLPNMLTDEGHLEDDLKSFRPLDASTGSSTTEEFRGLSDEEDDLNDGDIWGREEGGAQKKGHEVEIHLSIPDMSVGATMDDTPQCNKSTSNQYTPNGEGTCRQTAVEVQPGATLDRDDDMSAKCPNIWGLPESLNTTSNAGPPSCSSAAGEEVKDTAQSIEYKERDRTCLEITDSLSHSTDAAQPRSDCSSSYADSPNQITGTQSALKLSVGRAYMRGWDSLEMPSGSGETGLSWDSSQDSSDETTEVRHTVRVRGTVSVPRPRDEDMATIWLQESLGAEAVSSGGHGGECR